MKTEHLLKNIKDSLNTGFRDKSDVYCSLGIALINVLMEIRDAVRVLNDD